MTDKMYKGSVVGKKRINGFGIAKGANVFFDREDRF